MGEPDATELLSSLPSELAGSLLPALPVVVSARLRPQFTVRFSAENLGNRLLQKCTLPRPQQTHQRLVERDGDTGLHGQHVIGLADAADGHLRGSAAARFGCHPVELHVRHQVAQVGGGSHLPLFEIGAADLSGAGAAFGAVTQVGPIVTVLIVAGAGATAICADLGARTIREEIDAMRVLEMVRSNYNVDDDRIYLMGHSMGGAGTYYLGARYNDLWAGVAPIAGAGGIRDRETAERFRSLPTLVMHGELDSIVPAAGSRRGHRHYSPEGARGCKRSGPQRA